MKSEIGGDDRLYASSAAPVTCLFQDVSAEDYAYLWKTSIERPTCIKRPTSCQYSKGGRLKEVQLYSVSKKDSEVFCPLTL